MGAGSAMSLGRHAEGVWRWSGQLVFGAIAILVWLLWGYVMFSTDPLRLEALYTQLAPVPDRSLDPAVVASCVLASAGAVFLMFRARPRQAALQTWTVGLALCWLLLAGLLMPWADQVKSYRQVFTSLRLALPASAGCVASRGLDESERAMLDYYDGLITKRLELQRHADCLLLVEEHHERPVARVDARAWAAIWEGARPGDHQERFRLYRRRP